MKDMGDWIRRNPEVPEKVSDIVAHNTGMPKELLREDATEYSINNIPEAAELFLKHAKAGNVVRVHTDYDTDGWGASVIMTILLDEIVTKVVPGFKGKWKVHVPCRYSDGFGVRVRHIEKYAEEGASLVITCDNGIAAIDAAKRAKELGADMIILDHHDIAEVDGVPTLPAADVIVDPHITGGTFEDYCGAGIALYFAREVMKQLGVPGGMFRDMDERLTAVAAISTVGDVVSLSWDNRRIVRDGLKRLAEEPPTKGLKALLEEKRMTRITSTDVAFTLSPIINAPGRLQPQGTARMVETLGYRGKMNDDIRKAVQEFIAVNKERQVLTAEGLERAELYLEQTGQRNAPFLLVADASLSTGVAGLVSGKLTEKYKRPSIVLAGTADPEVYKGSGRSPEWCSMIALLKKNAKYMEAYGGHPGACGLTVRLENIEGFRKAMTDSMPPVPEGLDEDNVYFDMECTPKDVPALFTAVDMFGPYGQDNPEIQVKVTGIHLVNDATGNRYRVMGSNGSHIKLYADDGFQLVWFGGKQAYVDLGEPEYVDVIGTLSLNVFMDSSTIQIQVTDLKASANRFV
jgi:single-stranded-DNA-specific exonuclease